MKPELRKWLMDHIYIEHPIGDHTDDPVLFVGSLSVPLFRADIGIPDDVIDWDTGYAYRTGDEFAKQLLINVLEVKFYEDIREQFEDVER